MKKFRFIFLLLIAVAANAQIRIVPQTGHIGWFTMDVSPDGKRMLSAGPEGKVILWDLVSFKAIWYEYIHRAPINQVKWRMDNRYFLTACEDSTVTVWDTESMKKIRTYHSKYPITSAAFNPKADLITYGDTKGNIFMFHLVSNEQILHFNVGSSVNDMVWVDNGYVLFAGTEKHGVMGFEMDKGKKILDMKMTDAVTELQLSPNNKILIINLAGGSTEIWNPSSGKGYGSMQNAVVKSKNGYKQFSRPAATFDGQFVLMYDKDHNLQIGRLDPVLTQIYDAKMLQNEIRMIKASPANNSFLLADMDGGIWICFFTENDFNDQSRLYWHKMLFEPERIRNLYFKPNDESIAMKGSYEYEFNFKTGDLTRREDDSTALENTTTTMKFFSPSRMADGIYYAIHTTKDEMYKIKDQEYVEPVTMYALSKDTAVVAYIDNNQLNIYHIKEARFLKQEKVNLKGYTLFNGHLNNQFVTLDKKGLRFIECNTLQEKTLKDAGKLQLAWLTASEDNSIVHACDTKGIYYSWETASGKAIAAKGDLAKIKISQFEVDKNNSMMIATTFDQRLVRIELASGKITHELNSKLPPVIHLSINHKCDRVAIADLDGVVHIFDTQLQKEIISIIPSPTNGLIAYTPDNYYIATKEAAQNVALVNGNSVLGFEQIDLRYNRPDKVLSSIGIADAGVIASYERAWKKRMERSGIMESTGNEVPTVELANFKSIPLTTDQTELELHVKGTSQKGIKAVKIWVRGVPVLGRNGKEFASKDIKNSIDIKLKAPLIFGTNKIEIATVSTNGTESEKVEFLITGKKEIPQDLYIVSIGVSKYNDNRYNLRYADKDATDLVGALKNTRAFANVHSELITNENVTREKVIATKELLKKSRPNDVVLVFVAGHGLRDAKYDYYFATHDIDFNDPGKRGVSDTELENLLDCIGSLRKLLFFDTCLSGEVDKNEVETTGTISTEAGDVSFRNTGIGLRNKQPLGLKNAQFLMKEVFNDVKRGTGATVISSAGGVELAMESSQWKNGLFTYCVLTGLKEKSADKDKDGEVSLSELQQYVKKEVTLLSKGRQLPDFKSANMDLDFRLW
ncbi:MAG TPA: hypothetical protein DEP18_06405 [Flavobacteriales bacterium]|nr:hypothetical protein [Flavobacteriales bacterium]HRE74034.1 caspase family protein [Flavobacteriales bacterium]HRJ38288.1 caspase family protein [Flavobacteriales bacterium]